MQWGIARPVKGVRWPGCADKRGAWRGSRTWRRRLRVSGERSGEDEGECHMVRVWAMGRGRRAAESKSEGCQAG